MRNRFDRQLAMLDDMLIRMGELCEIAITNAAQALKENDLEQAHTVMEADEEIDQIRIAFDGDAVIFSDESEKIFQSEGLAAFEEHERLNARKPLPEGPFAKLLSTISLVQKRFGSDHAPIRTALVTSRNAPAHERVIRTLRVWDIRIDEVFFMGGIRKSDVLKAFGAHIFFDDQAVHTDPASKLVPAARVPYKTVPATEE